METVNPTPGGRPIESQPLCTARISARRGSPNAACTHTHTHITHVHMHTRAHMRISVCDAFPTDATNAAADSCGSSARNRSSHRAAVQRARSRILYEKFGFPYVRRISKNVIARKSDEGKDDTGIVARKFSPVPKYKSKHASYCNLCAR